MQNLPQHTVVRVGRYDQVTAIMIALIMVFGLAAIFLLTMVVSRSSVINVLKGTVPVELIELSGGNLDGNTTDPTQTGPGSAAELIAIQADVSPMEIEKVPHEDVLVSMSSDAVEQMEQAVGLVSSSDVGKTNGKGAGGVGTGNRRLTGAWPGYGGGFPREQRWFIRYVDTGSLDEYAQQLDYFGIELGAIVGKQLVYLSKMSGNAPQVRRVSGGSNEKRLYFTWQGGKRKAADVELFRKAGVEPGDGMILQFYPKSTENKLAEIELKYEALQHNQIRRTYFSVHKAEGGSGYEFYVTRQVSIN